MDQNKPQTLPSHITITTPLQPVAGNSALSQITRSDAMETEVENVRKRKRTSILKDENAPKPPLTGYQRFMIKYRDIVRAERPDILFQEVTKILGTMWTGLPQNHKQSYLDEADKEKEKYLQDLDKHKKSDAYKAFLAQQKAAQKDAEKANAGHGQLDSPLFCLPCNKQFFSAHNKNEHLAGRKHRMALSRSPHGIQHTTNVPKPRVVSNTAPPQGPTVETSADGAPAAENSLDIPVFSQQFLDYNKRRESELRKLKKATNECEEQNAILAKHNDHMKSAITKLEQEGKRCKEEITNLEPFLSNLRSVLSQSFAEIRSSGPNQTANENSIDDFLQQMCTASQNMENEDETLAKIKHVVTQLDYPNCLDPVIS